VSACASPGPSGENGSCLLPRDRAQFEPQQCGDGLNLWKAVRVGEVMRFLIPRVRRLGAVWAVDLAEADSLAESLERFQFGLCDGRDGVSIRLRIREDPSPSKKPAAQASPSRLDARHRSVVLLSAAVQLPIGALSHCIQGLGLLDRAEVGPESSDDPDHFRLPICLEVVDFPLRPPPVSASHVRPVEVPDAHDVSEKTKWLKAGLFDGYPDVATSFGVTDGSLSVEEPRRPG
jgi:hypothetical protein